MGFQLGAVRCRRRLKGCIALPALCSAFKHSFQRESEVSLGFKSTKHGAASQENSCEAVQKLIRKSQIALDLAEQDAAEKVDGIAPLPKEVFLQCGDLYTCSLLT